MSDQHSPNTSEQSLVALIQLLAAPPTTTKLQTLAQTALAQILVATELPGGSIWVWRHEGVGCIACHPVQSPSQAEQLEQAVLRVLASGQPEGLNAPAQHADASGAVLPLKGGSAPLGALVVDGVAAQHRRVLLDTGARMLAGALQQALLAEQVAEQARHIQEFAQQHDQLISMIAHDLKNPMASIKGYADLLRRRSERNPEDPNRRGLQVISEQITLMTELLDRLIDISRIASGHLQLKLRQADLALLLAEWIDELHGSNEAREITLEATEDPLPAVFDTQRIRQAVENVVQNALLYSPENAPIAIRLHSADDQVVISVQDQGIGVPDADRDQIFEPFLRGSNAAGYTGRGMGLFVAREILARHDGRIWFESSEGQGATFYIALPANA